MEQINSVNWKKVGFTAGLGVGGYLLTKKFVSKNQVAAIAGLAVGGAIGYFSYDKIFK
jgi:uncharacterized membrane protein YjjB (DUF3815 family)